MPRKGIFRRFIDRIFPPEPAPPSPPPPPERPPPGGGDTGGPFGPFRRIWNRTVPDPVIDSIQDRTGYSEREIFELHYEVMAQLDPGMDTEIAKDMWTDYLAAFVNGNVTRDVFWDTWNIDPRDFDWQLWREAMGYGRAK